jgi:hypothetical protein
MADEADAEKEPEAEPEAEAAEPAAAAAEPEPAGEADPEQEAAATKLQAIHRGNQVRKPAVDNSVPSPKPSDAERRALADARANARVSDPRTLSQLGLKTGLPADPVPGLRFLTFYSWWHESGTKRYMEICFDLQTELFQARTSPSPPGPAHFAPQPVALARGQQH